jgi:hypothetical protein
MPISLALLFCIPIGLLFYFEARWLIRYFSGRFEQKERRAARLFGIFGVLLIPLIYCSGLIEHEFPGRFGKPIAIGLCAVVFLGLFGPALATLNERK